MPPKALVFGACLECIESACVTLVSVRALNTAHMVQGELMIYLVAGAIFNDETVFELL